MKTKTTKRLSAWVTPILIVCLALTAAFTALPKLFSVNAEQTVTYNNYLPDAAPTFSKAGGVYYSDDSDGNNVSWACGTFDSNNQTELQSARLGNIELATVAAGAEIYYTTDGSVPTSENGTKYGGGFTLNKGTHRVRAVAYKDGKYSDVSEKVYYVGSENFMNSGATLSCNDGWDETVGSLTNGPTGYKGIETLAGVIGTTQSGHGSNGVWRIFSSYRDKDFGFEYLQVKLSAEQNINYLTFSSYWPYWAFPNHSDYPWWIEIGKIEIGNEGETFTTVWTTPGGDVYTQDGYVAENAARFGDGNWVTNFGLFLENPVQGQCIRYYPKTDALGINFVTAAHFDKTPAEVEAETVTKIIPAQREVRKAYAEIREKSQIIADLAEEYKITIGSEQIPCTWTSDDFVDGANGIYTFIGVPSSIPSGYTNLYNAAIKATVAVAEINDTPYDDSLKVNNYIKDAAPVFDKKGGVYFDCDISGFEWGRRDSRLGKISLTTSLDGAEIFYTADGSVPTKDSTKYTEAFTLSAGAHVVSAVAYKDGAYSAVSSRTYYVGGENYLSKGTSSFGPNFNNSVLNSWGGPAVTADGMISTIAGSIMRSDTCAALASSSNYEYWQIDMGETKQINYLQMSGLWGTPGISENIYCNKIEIGDGENWTVAWQKPSAATTNKDGYIAENAVKGPQNTYISYATFLRTPVSGRYVRYYNEGGDLHLNYALATYFPQTPPANEAKLPVAVQDGFTFEKNYTAETTVRAVLSDLTRDNSSMTIGDKTYGVSWYAPSDFDGVYGGTFTFIGLPQDLPNDVVNLYNVALVAEVSVPVKTNPTKLQAYISGIDVQEESKYTSSTWATYSASLSAAQEIINALKVDEAAKTQQEVDDALEALKASVSELALLGDKTALNDKITAVKDTPLTGYTHSTASAFTEKLNAAQTVAASNNVTQQEVDAALADLIAAFEGLLLKADLTALQARIAELENADTTGKTPESIATFNEALNAAREVVSAAEPSQKEADDALAALNNAFAGLTDLADKTALNAKLGEARVEAEKNIYTSGSLAMLCEAIEDAQEVAGDVNATQSEVDAATAALTEALDDMEKLGDRTALIAAVEELEGGESKYTPSSWTAFTATLTELRVVAADTDASESEVARAMNLLETEKAKLVLRADISELTEKLGITLVQSHYTAASWLVYANARNNALEVISDANATQEQVDDALNALNSAIDGLGKPGDKTELNALIAEAKGKKQTDALKKAIADAEAISADAQASEQDVAAAVAALRSAMNDSGKKGGCGGNAYGASGLAAVFALAIAALIAMRRKRA